MEAVNPGVNVDFRDIPVRSKFFGVNTCESRSSDDSLDRNDRIVADIERFGHMTSKMIEALHFSYATEGSANVMAWETLTALREAGRIGRIEKSRMSGGSKKGSTGYVFVPASSSAENPNFHKLDIASLYRDLVVASRTGDFRLIEFAPERHAHIKIGAVEFEPDARVVIERGGVRRRFHVEIDKATEKRPKLREKVGNYVQAWDEWDDGKFPPVVFVVAHERPENVKRALAAIKHVIDELDEQDREPFSVIPYDEAVATLSAI